MEIILIRKTMTKKCVIGELFVNGNFECFTLEDIERPVKIAGLTAISRGHYEVVVTYSQRFKKLLPLLLNVPQFDGIRIHPGNVAENTEGCILVGTGKAKDLITSSRVAFKALFEKIEKASKKEKIFIEIKGDYKLSWM